MENLDPTFKIDVEALKSLLLRQKITRAVFSIPITAEQALSCLRAAYNAEVSYRGGVFNETEEVTSLLVKTAMFLTTTNYKKHSLVLCGKCGNGKTTLARSIQTIFSHLQPTDEHGEKKCVLLHTAKQLVRIANMDINAFNKICKEPLLTIDDLGNESVEQNNYGNIFTPIIDMIEYRYEKQLPMIITTNLTPSQIGQRYSERVADRIAEIANVLVFTNNSYRL